jgi:hypothetical protein
MSTRARYDGPHDAVEVYLPSGRTVTVERGHLLPTEDDAGDTIPASVRDSLLEQSDVWSDVKQTTTTSSKKED